MNENFNGFRMPAEWEPQNSVWIAWPYNKNDWPRLYQFIPEVILKIIKKISKNQKVNLIVSKNIKNIKKLIKLNKIKNINFHYIKTDRIWLRDSGPIFITNKVEKKKVMLNFGFNGWSKYKNYKNDNKINNSISRKLRFDLVDFFISNQIWFYFSLLLLGLILRLFQLDYRAVHHDESLHGYFSYRLYTGEEYSHNPLMHGMLLFHLLTASFFIFGDSDFTMRLPMVLVGSLLIFLPYFLKNYIGNVSAFFISIFLTISPTLVYFSRFARNDILIAFTTVFLIIGIWKYISSGRNFWLYSSAFIISTAL